MKKAFTLVELLVVIAIIGLLVSIIVPMLHSKQFQKTETISGVIKDVQIATPPDSQVESVLFTFEDGTVIRLRMAANDNLSIQKKKWTIITYREWDKLIQKIETKEAHGLED